MQQWRGQVKKKNTVRQNYFTSAMHKINRTTMRKELLHAHIQTTLRANTCTNCVQEATHSAHHRSEATKYAREKIETRQDMLYYTHTEACTPYDWVLMTFLLFIIHHLLSSSRSTLDWNCLQPFSTFVQNILCWMHVVWCKHVCVWCVCVRVGHRCIIEVEVEWMQQQQSNIAVSRVRTRISVFFVCIQYTPIFFFPWRDSTKLVVLRLVVSSAALRLTSPLLRLE